MTTTTIIPTSELKKVFSLIVLKKTNYPVLDNLLVQVYPDKTVINSTDLATTQSFVLSATNPEIGSFLIPFQFVKKLVAKTKIKEVGLTPNEVLLDEVFPFEVQDKAEDFPNCLCQFAPLFELSFDQIKQLSQLSEFTDKNKFALNNVEVQGQTNGIKAIATDGVAAVINEWGDAHVKSDFRVLIPQQTIQLAHKHAKKFKVRTIQVGLDDGNIVFQLNNDRINQKMSETKYPNVEGLSFWQEYPRTPVQFPVKELREGLDNCLEYAISTKNKFFTTFTIDGNKAVLTLEEFEQTLPVQSDNLKFCVDAKRFRDFLQLFSSPVVVLEFLNITIQNGAVREGGMLVTEGDLRAVLMLANFRFR